MIREHISTFDVVILLVNCHSTIGVFQTLQMYFSIYKCFSSWTYHITITIRNVADLMWILITFLPHSQQIWKCMFGCVSVCFYVNAKKMEISNQLKKSDTSFLACFWDQNIFRHKLKGVKEANTVNGKIASTLCTTVDTNSIGNRNIVYKNCLLSHVDVIIDLFENAIRKTVTFNVIGNIENHREPYVLDSINFKWQKN